MVGVKKVGQRMVWVGAGGVGRARSPRALQPRLRSFVFTAERLGEQVRVGFGKYRFAL